MVVRFNLMDHAISIALALTMKTKTLPVMSKTLVIRFLFTAFPDAHRMP
jgi:hypothetical protein